MIKIKHAPGESIAIRPRVGADRRAQISGDSTADVELAFGAATVTDRALEQLNTLCAQCATTAEILQHLTFEDGVYDMHTSDEFAHGEWVEL